MSWPEDLFTLFTPLVPAGRLFYSSVAIIPSDRETALSFQEVPGLAPELVHNDLLPRYQQPEAQVVARAAKYTDARSLAKAAWELCYTVGTVGNESINGTQYLWIRPRQDPFDLTPDSAGRARVAFNVLGYKARS